MEQKLVESKVWVIKGIGELYLGTNQIGFHKTGVKKRVAVKFVSENPINIYEAIIKAKEQFFKIDHITAVKLHTIQSGHKGSMSKEAKIFKNF